MAQSSTLDPLLALGLDHTLLGSEGLAEIAEGSGFPALRLLVAKASRVGDAGVSALATSEPRKRLIELDLDHNEIGDEGAAALAQSGVLRALREVRMDFNPVGDAGAAAWAETRLRLRQLSLRSTQIGPAGTQALRGSQRLKGCDIKLDRP